VPLDGKTLTVAQKGVTVAGRHGDEHPGVRPALSHTNARASSVGVDNAGGGVQHRRRSAERRSALGAGGSHRL